MTLLCLLSISSICSIGLLSQSSLPSNLQCGHHTCMPPKKKGEIGESKYAPRFGRIITFPGCKFRNDGGADNRGGGASSFNSWTSFVLSSSRLFPSIRWFVPSRLSSLFAFLVPRPYNCHIWTRRDASTAESNIVARPFISSDELHWDRCALQSSALFDDWEFDKFSRLKLKTPQQERLQYN